MAAYKEEKRKKQEYTLSLTRRGKIVSLNGIHRDISILNGLLLI